LTPCLLKRQSWLIDVQQTDVFIKWLDGLRDDKAVARISNRIDRLALGNPGEVKSVGEGVSEMKIDYGPGYHLYFTKRGKVIVLLFWGGTKGTQESDTMVAHRSSQQCPVRTTSSAGLRQQ
jgi:putative addiction module killer protein